MIVDPNDRGRWLGSVSDQARQVYRAVLVDEYIRPSGDLCDRLCKQNIFEKWNIIDDWFLIIQDSNFFWQKFIEIAIEEYTLRAYIDTENWIKLKEMGHAGGRERKLSNALTIRWWKVSYSLFRSMFKRTFINRMEIIVFSTQYFSICWIWCAAIRSDIRLLTERINFPGS